MEESHRLLRAALGACAALLLAAAPASAAPAVANASAKPTSTAAGANSDFTVSFDLTGLGDVASGDDLKSVRLDLPAGLLGNPQATGGTCTKAQFTADECPAPTKVGTTTTTASVRIALVDAPQTIDGDIYNIATTGSEAARLGIVLRPAGGVLPKVFLESPASVRSSDGGLTSVVDNIPREAAGMALRIDAMKLTLNGKAGSGKAFMNNPTSCNAAPTTITVGTYANATASAAPSFTPTDCDKLPFAPQIMATIGSTRDDLRPRAQPQVVVTVTQKPGEANAKSVAVALPIGFGASVEALGNACPVAQYDAGTCPPNSVVGSASAATPLLAQPLTGPVTFVSDPSLGLPRLRVALHGAFDVNLAGVVTTGPKGNLINTFDGIYDVPLSKFVLTINAGPTSPVRVSRDLCLPGAALFSGTFVAHSGKTATAETTGERVGCENVGPTLLRARLGRLKAGRPPLRLTAANNDRNVKRLSFRLPKGLSFSARAKKLVVLSNSAPGVTGKVGLRKGRMTVTLSGDGAPTTEVLLRSRAIRVAKSLRRARRPRVAKLAVAVQLAGRPPQTQRVSLKLTKKA